jgi:hypothetical protein
MRPFLPAKPAICGISGTDQSKDNDRIKKSVW